MEKRNLLDNSDRSRSHLHLVYIANARIPTDRAHGLQIMKMCEAFSKAVGKVELILPFRFQFREMRAAKDIFDYYKIRKRLPVRKIPNPDFVPIRLHWEKLSNHLFALQSATFSLVASFCALLKFRGVNNAMLFFTRDWLVASRLIKLGLPTILEEHTLHKSRSALKQVLRMAHSKNLLLMITVTNALKESYIEAGVPASKILALHDGIDIEMLDIPLTKTEAKRKLGLLPNRKHIIYTGHLYKWKGVYILAEASAFLRDAEIIIVGGIAVDIAALEEFIARRGYENIRLVGYVEPGLVPYYLKAADVLVLPNSGTSDTSRYYTSPLKLFEYMASRRPIVASALPSIMEVLRHEDNAVLVEPDNPRALGDGIKRVLDDPDLASRISEQAYIDVQQFNWEKRAAAIIQTVMSKRELWI